MFNMYIFNKNQLFSSINWIIFRTHFTLICTSISGAVAKFLTCCIDIYRFCLCISECSISESHSFLGFLGEPCIFYLPQTMPWHLLQRPSQVCWLSSKFLDHSCRCKILVWFVRIDVLFWYFTWKSIDLWEKKTCCNLI